VLVQENVIETMERFILKLRRKV